MKPEKGKCKKCGYEHAIINNSRGVCIECVYKANHDGKNRMQVAYEKQLTKKVVRKVTGELAMFKEIWEERPHYCQNLNCRKWLGHDLQVWFFSHRIAKSVAPKLRLVKTNIDLLCRDCHTEWDHGDRNKVVLMSIG